jgi:hypothetical protein
MEPQETPLVQVALVLANMAQALVPTPAITPLAPTALLVA